MSWNNRIKAMGEKPADQFLFNPRNAREHPQAQREAVEGSLNELGWVAPVIENITTGYLLDGHERVWQALQRGEDTPVPFIQVELAEHEEPLFLAAFDYITQMARYDRDMLDGLMRDIQTGEAGLQAMLAEMADATGLEWGDPPEEADAEPQTSRAEELREQWGVEPGQLWRLPSRTPGQEHRLICGDCTDAATVARVMGGERADMVNIDPPYGVDYHGASPTMYYSGKKQQARKRIENDLSPDEAFVLLGDALSLFPAPIAFVWCAPQYYREALTTAEGAGWKMFSALVWNKNAASFAAMGATYKPKYEMALACKRDKIPFYGPNNETTVWDVDRLAVNEHHPTQKPVPLFERAIRNHTQPGEIVADFFSGSGTTIIAAENLARQCRAVEISPGYVAVALQRYLDAFGIRAELVED